MDVEIGIRLPPPDSLAEPMDIVTAARRAQGLGFHSLWASDHVVLPQAVDSFYPYSPGHRWSSSPDDSWPEPLLTLSWAAAVAPDVKVGTSVLVAPIRHPIHLAHQAATLDWLTGGRLLLGIGIGWMREEFEFLHADFEKRGSRAVETVEVMRQLWKGGPVDVSSENWKLSGAVMSPRPPRGAVPIIWGGKNERTLRRVARLGDGWYPLGLDFRELEAGVNRLAGLCGAEGRDFARLTIVASLGRSMPVTPANVRRLRDIGVNHVVAGLTESAGAEPSRQESAWKEIADLCGLEPRG